MHFLTFLAGGNAQNTTIHEPVRLTMCSFWVLYDLSSGFLGMILMHFIIKKHISSLEPSALAKHFITRYMQLHAGYGLLLPKMMAQDLLYAEPNLILICIHSTDHCVMSLERKGSRGRVQKRFEVVREGVEAL